MKIIEAKSFLKALGVRGLPVASALENLSAFGSAKKQVVKIVEFDASGVRNWRGGSGEGGKARSGMEEAVNG